MSYPKVIEDSVLSAAAASATNCGLADTACVYVEFKNLHASETMYVGWDGANADIPLPAGESIQLGMARANTAMYKKVSTSADLALLVWAV